MSVNGTFHQHLIEELRALIRGGDFVPGAQFLTERDIAERFKTSRPTANKALSSLVSQGLLEKRTDAKSSLYRCWTEKCGLEITGAEEVIHAVNATKAQAAHLQISSGTACFEIVATGFANDNQPLWQETTLYRADVYEFRNRISGLTASHSAMGRIKE
jgi:DNA-binding GntR family transcriptional regulator